MENAFKEKTIAVLMGGLSQEREISLKSGQAVLKALLTLGYDAVGIDVSEEIGRALEVEGVEAAFIALHGRFGEDGCIQGLLELQRIPYTGSSVLASSLCIDKYLSKELLRTTPLKMPADCFYLADQDFATVWQQAPLNCPVIVKPSREGSTIGIQKVLSEDELPKAVQAAAKLDTRVLIEEFIVGREVTVGLLDGEPLPIVEVKPKSGFYDYESKYTPGATEYFCPADLPDALTKKLQADAALVWQYLGCEGFARVDFLISEAGEAYFLEVNTIPGMTETSLVPKAAAAAGMSFETLVERILLTARLKT